MVHSKEESELFIKELEKEFKITVKPATYFLGLEIERQENSINICEQAFVKKLLQRFNFHDCKPVSTPMTKLDAHDSEHNRNSSFPYREAVGALMYLMVCTRPNLAYNISVLSRTLDCSSNQDIVRLKRILRYIIGSSSLGIRYTANGSRELSCYSDADFGGCNKTGHGSRSDVRRRGSVNK
ncbi:uncharacterized protein [Halyomorpha halys]|uniref:uncharacterized protein n=1 Tax=Halyomorpha halys TaxID=286706 RepID=UPI0034D37C6F